MRTENSSFSARGPLVKYPSNKVNLYQEKVISARRAKNNWLCEEQFRATFADLVLQESFSGPCSSDFRRKSFLAILLEFL